MIINAKDLEKAYSHEDVVEEFCNRIQKKICKINSKGGHCTCFYESPIVYNNDKGKFEWGHCDKPWLHFDNYRDEVAERFIKAGYKIKPTGYIGGVWQQTEDIYW